MTGQVTQIALSIPKGTSLDTAHDQVNSYMSGIGMSWLHTIPIPLAITMAIAGLGIFLFAIRIMSNSLKGMTSGYTVKLLKKFGSKPLLGLLFGFVFTSIIQSSGGAVALAIGLLGAGMMNMKGAIAFLLGANIGTSTTSLIVWLSASASFTQYFMIFAFVGVMILMIVKEEKISNIATLVAAFGMIFVGLKMLGWGMDRVGDTTAFKDMFEAVAVNPWSGMFASIGLTGLMQSSSASITIVQHMYEAHADPSFLPSAIAMILGANIGTTFIAFLISVGGNRDAKRIAVIWLFTNTVFAFIFMFLIYPWDGYATLMQDITSSAPGQLAMAHLFFNIILSCTFIWFVKQLNWFAYKVVPNKKSKYVYNTNLPQELLNQSAELAFYAARKVTKELAVMTKDAVQKLIKYMDTKDKHEYEDLKEILEIIDVTRSNLYSYLVEIGAGDMSKAVANKHMSLVLAARSIERIPVLGQQLFHDLNKTLDRKKGYFNIPEEEFVELRTILVIVKSMTKRIPNLITRFNKEKVSEINELAAKANELKEQFERNFIARKKRPINDFDYLVQLKTVQRMAHHGERVAKYINKGRKDIVFKELPAKLNKEISTDL